MIRRLLPLVAATVLVACGSGDGDAGSTAVDTASPATATPAATAPPTPTGGGTVAEVPPALQFSAPLVGGGEIELDAYAGRPVLLWFWAPW